MNVWVMHLKDNRDVVRIPHNLKHQICMHLGIVAMGWYKDDSLSAKSSEKRLRSLSYGDVIWIVNPDKNSYTLVRVTDESITKEFSNLYEADINLARHIRVLTTIKKVVLWERFSVRLTSRKFLEKTARKDVVKATESILEELE